MLDLTIEMRMVLPLGKRGTGFEFITGFIKLLPVLIPNINIGAVWGAKQSFLLPHRLFTIAHLSLRDHLAINSVGLRIREIAIMSYHSVTSPLRAIKRMLYR